MKTLSDLIDNVIDTIAAVPSLDIPAEKIVFGATAFEPPSVNVAIYPIATPKSEASSGEWTPAAVDIYLHTPGKSSEKEAIVSAMQKAALVTAELAKNRDLTRFLGISIGIYTDEHGRVVRSDSTTLVIQYESRVTLG